MNTQLVAYARDYVGSDQYLVVSKPTGTIDNDVMVAIILCVGQDDPVSEPSGWTLLATGLNGAAGKHWLYYKIAASEGATYTWEWAGNAKRSCVIATYRGGIDLSDPIADVSSDSYEVDNTTLRAGSVTVAGESSTYLYQKATLVFAGSAYSTGTLTATAPTGWTEDVDTGDVTSDMWQFFYHYLSDTNCESGDIDATLSAAKTNKHAFLIVFNPSYAPRKIINSYQKFVEYGGYVAHLWHVAGYPWAVTDDSALIDALSDTNDDVIIAARERLFGSNEFTSHDGTCKPCLDVPIFDTLVRDFGTVEFRADTTGMLSGGGWKIKILDKDLQHTWKHAVATDEIWGIEGVHRIANPRMSTGNGWSWGFIRKNFLRNIGGTPPEEIDISEETNTLQARITALGSGEYVVLWNDHEAVAVTDYTGTWPDYSLTLPDYAAAGMNSRGLYKSRTADHFTSDLAHVDPIIADVPPGIDNRHCWLYSIPMIDGAICVDADGTPIIAEELRGVVSADWKTTDGETQITIMPELSALEIPGEVELSRAAAQSMAGFTLSRWLGGNDIDSILTYRQMPHLVIYEPKHDNDDGDTFESAEILYLWFTPKNTTRSWDSLTSMVEEINDELDKCYRNIPGRINEDCTLRWPYKIVRGNRDDVKGYKLRRELNSWYNTENTPNRFSPLFAGFLPWAMVLGRPIVPDESIYARWQTSAVWSHLYIDFAHHQAIPISPVSQDRYWMQEDIRAMNDWPDDYHIPRYIHQYAWANQTIVDEWDISTARPGQNTPTGPEAVPRVPWTPAAGKIWLSPDTSTEIFVEGETAYLGDGSAFPALHATVDEVAPDTVLDLLSMTTDGVTWLNDDYAIPFGVSLWYTPIVAHWVEDETRGDDWQPDQHLLQKSDNVLASPDLQDILQAMLGAPAVTNQRMTKEAQLSHVPFFLTDDDFISSIDWDSFRHCIPLRQQYYRATIEKDTTVLSILKTELLFHRCALSLSWDNDLLMWRYKVIPFDPISAISARQSGHHLRYTRAVPGSQVETHGWGKIYNRLEVLITSEHINIQHKGSLIPGSTEMRTLTIKPVASTVAGLLTDLAIAEWSVEFSRLLAIVSQPRFDQARGITLEQSFFGVGEGMLVTDPTAPEPLTHRIGLSSRPAQIVLRKWDPAKLTGSLIYSISEHSDDAGGTRGIAPAAYCLAVNHGIQDEVWYLQPEAHYYSDSADMADVYRFDCWDLVSGELTRRTCSCGDYAVLAIEVGNPDWTPLALTCSVSADGVMALEGNLETVDPACDYVIVFADYGTVESCQAEWCYMAGTDNLIGTIEVTARRWE